MQQLLHIAVCSTFPAVSGGGVLSPLSTSVPG